MALLAYSRNMGDHKRPPWVRKVLLIAGIAGPLCGALGVVVNTYFDIKSKASEAKKKTEAGYETLAPAIEELQELMADGQDWAEDADEEILRLQVDFESCDARLSRLEGYVEALGGRRGLPPLPDVEPSSMMTDLGPVAIVGDSEDPRVVVKKAAKKPSRPVPTDINQAAKYQQKRVDLNCTKSDPLCGSLK